MTLELITTTNDKIIIKVAPVVLPLQSDLLSYEHHSEKIVKP